MRFTLRFAIAIVIAAVVAAMVSPFVALGLAAAGYHFPFPRIFDRTVMAAIAVILLLWARNLRLMPLLRRGFAHPADNAGSALRGFLVAIAAIAILLALGAAFGGRAESVGADTVARVPKYVGGAIAIAIIEEGFFRAVLLGGMVEDLGRVGGLVASAAVYALAHLLRSPRHFELARLDVATGFHVLALSMARLLHPDTVLPALIGLFLLGLVLGEAFLVTGTIYFSAGLHAGLVIGVRLWPYSVAPGLAPPHWIAGYGRPALISGEAGWLIAIIILTLLPRLTDRRT
jgi:uncharacterized protein